MYVSPFRLNLISIIPSYSSSLFSVVVIVSISTSTILVHKKELDTLYHQFNTMDVDQDGYINQKEFKNGLGIDINDQLLPSFLPSFFAC